MTTQLQLLSPAEVELRVSRMQLEAPALIADNANIFYLTGRVFAGYVYLTPAGRVHYFVKRPTTLTGPDITLIHKPEDIAAHLPERPAVLALELASLPYADAMRLKAALGATQLADVSPRIAAARAVKTPTEIKLMEMDGIRHAEIYSRIPSLFREGMNDVELQIEIERVSRLHGCLGLFRVNGPSMELHMGSVITGENADTPSPYDFAMGGAGLHPSIPVGASGEEIRPGKAVMVDMNGNFNGYMTDMTRVFSFGSLPEHAVKAHSCSISICRALQQAAQPGTPCSELYQLALSMATDAALADCFMGHRHHAGFVGHGVGIQVNELPVLAPRSKQLITEGNVIAIEPKFVIPGVGAVGIENTYVATATGLRCITMAPEEIISLK